MNTDTTLACAIAANYLSASGDKYNKFLRYVNDVEDRTIAEAVNDPNFLEDMPEYLYRPTSVKTFVIDKSINGVSVNGYKKDRLVTSLVHHSRRGRFKEALFFGLEFYSMGFGRNKSIQTNFTNHCMLAAFDDIGISNIEALYKISEDIDNIYHQDETLVLSDRIYPIIATLSMSTHSRIHDNFMKFYNTTTDDQVVEIKMAVTSEELSAKHERSNKKLTQKLALLAYSLTKKKYSAIYAIKQIIKISGVAKSIPHIFDIYRLNGQGKPHILKLINFCQKWAVKWNSNKSASRRIPSYIPAYAIIYEDYIDWSSSTFNNIVLEPGNHEYFSANVLNNFRPRAVNHYMSNYDVAFEDTYISDLPWNQEKAKDKFNTTSFMRLFKGVNIDDYPKNVMQSKRKNLEKVENYTKKLMESLYVQINFAYVFGISRMHVKDFMVVEDTAYLLNYGAIFSDLRETPALSNSMKSMIASSGATENTLGILTSWMDDTWIGNVTTTSRWQMLKRNSVDVGKVRQRLNNILNNPKYCFL